MTPIKNRIAPLSGFSTTACLLAAICLLAPLRPEAAAALDRGDCMRDPMFCEIEKNPDDVDLRLLRAAGWMARKEYKKAIEDYTAAIELDPDDAEIYFRRAIANDAAGNSFASYDDYHKTVDLEPKRLDYALALERSICSADDAVRVIRMYPKSPEVYLVRALCHQRRDSHTGTIDLDMAEKDLAKALSLNPDFAAAYYNRALLYVEKRNYKRALADLDSLERIDSDNADVYALRGVIRGIQGDLGAAVREHGKAIAADPLGAQRYLFRAWALLNAGQANAALADAGRAVMLNPANASAYETRGKIQEALGNKTMADLDFQTARLPEQARVSFAKSFGTSSSGDRGGSGPNYTLLIVLVGLSGLGLFLFRGRDAAHSATSAVAPAGPTPSTPLLQTPPVPEEAETVPAPPPPA